MLWGALAQSLPDIDFVTAFWMKPADALLARSIFDKENRISFTYSPRDESLLNKVDDHEEVQKLIRFSKGFYTAEKWSETLVFNDLRFGQIIGWNDPKEKFVFHYFLRHDADNGLVVQRGRFAKWNREIMQSLNKRIDGD